MRRAIAAYGSSILREQCASIEPNYPGLEQLISDMWDTMSNAQGCGLAASQIGLPIRIFIIDSKTTYKQLNKQDRALYFEETDTGTAETFINAQITWRSEDSWEDDEGCLSIPHLTQRIERSWSVTIDYFDKRFQHHVKTFHGMTARMIQHEYDHTEGILYLDHLKPITRKLMELKLSKIRKGQIETKYPMKFY